MFGHAFVYSNSIVQLPNEGIAMPAIDPHIDVRNTPIRDFTLHTHVFDTGNGTTQVDSGLPYVGRIFAIQDGDLLWYQYVGNGAGDRSGATGWAPNSGNPIGNGWADFQHVTGGDNDTGGFGTALYAADQKGDMHWYRYNGDGTADRSGATGWAPNSGKAIGNGW